MGPQEGPPAESHVGSMFDALHAGRLAGLLRTRVYEAGRPGIQVSTEVAKTAAHRGFPPRTGLTTGPASHLAHFPEQEGALRGHAQRTNAPYDVSESILILRVRPTTRDQPDTNPVDLVVWRRCPPKPQLFVRMQKSRKAAKLS